MMLTGSVSDDLGAVVVHEMAPPEVPSVATAGGVLSAVDGSPSRDRLARIAEMIRDAELAGEGSGPRHARVRDAGLIPLASRRNRARLRGRGARTAVDLAS
jgi:hypothetical protein